MLELLDRIAEYVPYGFIVAAVVLSAVLVWHADWKHRRHSERPKMRLYFGGKEIKSPERERYDQEGR